MAKEPKLCDSMQAFDKQESRYWTLTKGFGVVEESPKLKTEDAKELLKKIRNQLEWG
ncbi:MAG: hypothetical protein IJW40_02125 [Clostridia bacterium]|nr:hypothetical protein [Clostridia bacterium]